MPRSQNTEQQQDVAEPLYAARHYSVQELAELWGLGRTTIMRIFCNEPGVISVHPDSRATISRRRAPRRTLRIPAPVAERVHERLWSKGA